MIAFVLSIPAAVDAVLVTTWSWLAAAVRAGFTLAGF